MGPPVLSKMPGRYIEKLLDKFSRHLNGKENQGCFLVPKFLGTKLFWHPIKLFVYVTILFCQCSCPTF